MLSHQRKALLKWLSVAIGLAVALPLATSGVIGQAQSPKVSSVRLYVFDHGGIQLTPDAVRRVFGAPFDPDKFKHSRDMVTPLHVIVHPKGTLVWETGTSDHEIGKTPAPGSNGVTFVAPPTTVQEQLASIGYKAEDITYYAFSHNHSDHTGNSDLFARSTWLVRKAERDFIFPGGKPGPRMAHLAALQNAKTIVIDKDEHDVFGDGTVVLMNAQGHTVGQQVLYLKFAKSKPLLMAGDLYHYSEERPPTNWFPSSQLEADPAQSRASRARIEAFVEKNKADLLWSHDLERYGQLKKAPQYYE